MPDWTRTNFDELPDVSPVHVRIQWRFAREAVESCELGVSRFTYEPGARMPWGHRHREQEEIYVVLNGSGRAKLDDDFVELRPSDVLRLAPAVIRSFEAGPDGLELSASAAASQKAVTASGSRTSGLHSDTNGGHPSRSPSRSFASASDIPLIRSPSQDMSASIASCSFAWSRWLTPAKWASEKAE